MFTPSAPSGAGGHGVSPSTCDQHTCEQKPSTQKPLVHMSSLVHGAYMLSAGSPVLELSSSLDSAGSVLELPASVESVVGSVVGSVLGSVVGSGSVLGDELGSESSSESSSPLELSSTGPSPVVHASPVQPGGSSRSDF